MSTGPKPADARTLELTLAGDRRLAEEVALEVRALAARFGLEIPEVTITTARRGTARAGARKRVASRRP